MNEEAPPTWSAWTHLPKDQRRAILLAGLQGSLPQDRRLRPVAVMWSREWPRRGTPAAALSILVPGVLALVVGEGWPKTMALFSVALGVVGVVLVLVARSGIKASFHATEEAAERAKTQDGQAPSQA